MVDSNDGEQPMMPEPDPSLKHLEKLIGSWRMQGHLVGSDEENITGRAEFQWLEGGYFLQQDVQIDFAGMAQIKSREIVGYDAESGGLKSAVYSNMSPVPLPYYWKVDDDTMTISVSYGALDATFKGKFSNDGSSFSGGWRPNPGADEAVNIAYDIVATRLA